MDIKKRVEPYRNDLANFLVAAGFTGAGYSLLSDASQSREPEEDTPRYVRLLAPVGRGIETVMGLMTTVIGVLAAYDAVSGTVGTVRARRAAASSA